MKLGIIGLGEFNKSVHAPSILKYSKEIKHIDLALCDKNPAKIKEWQTRFGAYPSYSSIEEMLRVEKPDACYVTVLPAHSFDAVSRVLKFKIPVFTEKPPGNSPQETAKLIKLSKGILNAVGINRRHSPFIKKMKELAEKKIKGKYTFTSCTFLRSARYDKDFTNTLIHGIDTLRFLGGDFTSFSTQKTRVNGKKPFTNYLVTGTQTNSALTEMIVLPVSGQDAERYTISAEGITIETRLPFANEKGHLIVYRNGKPELHLTEKSLGLEHAQEFIKGGFYAQTKQFLDAIRKSGNPGTPFKETLQTMQLVI